MTKVLCDRCGKERRCLVVKIPWHVTEPDKQRGYVDDEGVHVSSREVSLDLCNACFNLAYEAMYSIIKEKP